MPRALQVGFSPEEVAICKESLRQNVLDCAKVANRAIVACIGVPLAARAGAVTSLCEPVAVCAGHPGAITA